MYWFVDNKEKNATLRARRHRILEERARLDSGKSVVPIRTTISVERLRTLLNNYSSMKLKIV